ncbi:DUF6801 domain-containing protein [Actinomadura verrucosospora]
MGMGAAERAAATVATVLAAMAIGSPPAAAGSLSQSYTCDVPRIGRQALTLETGAAFPSSFYAPYSPAEPAPVDVHSAIGLSADTARALTRWGARSVDGQLVLDTRFSAYGESRPVPVWSRVGATTVPARSSFTVRSTGEWQLPYRFPGQWRDVPATVDVEGLDLTLTPRDAAGRPTALGTLRAHCAPLPGRPTHLADTRIGYPPCDHCPGPSDHSYSAVVGGPSRLGALGASVPLNGRFDFVHRWDTDTYDGDLALDPVAFDFDLLGFLPGRVRLQFVQEGKATAPAGSGGVTFHVPMRVEVADFSLFGVRIGGGADCRTGRPADVRLERPGSFTYDPLFGAYQMPALSGCGPYTDMLNGLFAWSGGTIVLSLSPA